MKDLSKCTKNELIKIAKSYKITGYSKYNKDELLEYLLDKIDSKDIAVSGSKLNEYCSSAVFLYGVVSKEMLVTIYNIYEEQMPVLFQIDEWVKEFEKDFSDFFYQDGYFIKNRSVPVHTPVFYYVTAIREGRNHSRQSKPILLQNPEHLALIPQNPF